MFSKILIANRGEIAVRVARTAKRMGITTVAVYSDADANAPHVKACDEAVHIGPAPASESYLIADKIISAAKTTGAQAIHPGYGFLSENAAFADALDAAGIAFIGPTADTIRAMGSKSGAKDLMEAAHVPTTPGYQGEDQSLDMFKTECARIGYPVLLKATAGGGGKGMRLVEAEAELEEALNSAKREALASFGDERFLVEKYIARARHLEVQVFGDGEGDVVHMFERDCSVQRRHQKIIEEAPAPNLPEKVRSELLEAGVNAAKAVKYRGAGTVEFLYDEASEAVYFMEMNTRLQVEHPVSEEITGLDFVEWQLRIAAGEGLPLSQDQIGEFGHAFESRLYAEDPDADFAPAFGDVTHLNLPTDRARIDSGVAEGQTISTHYDPMIAKIITHGATRSEGLGRMRAALSETRVAGLQTNTRFLSRLAADENFATGNVSTRYIEDHSDSLFAAPDQSLAPHAALALHMSHFNALSGFRLNAPREFLHWISVDEQPALLRLVLRSKNRFELELERAASAAHRRETGKDYKAAPVESISFTAVRESESWTIELDGLMQRAHIADYSDGYRVWVGGESYDIALCNPLAGSGDAGGDGGGMIAKLPGVITLVDVTVGQSVAAGDVLMAMEAMKMEHTITAPEDGVIEAVFFAVGDQVSEGDVLIKFED
jgi:3-methylcrotonyl-CoA carboxylase alpha subunit